MDLKELAAVTVELAALERMTSQELATSYAAYFGEPPRSQNRRHLLKVLAWSIQERRLGGLSMRAIGRIEALMPSGTLSLSPRPAARKPAPKLRMPKPRDPRLPPVGQDIVRDEGGIEYRVTVVEDGFSFKGKYYKSLSAIARAITGTQWNGYRFFYGNQAASAKKGASHA